MKIKGIIIICTFFIVFLGSSVFHNTLAKEDPAVPEDVIKIGVIIDMTGPTATLQSPGPKAMRTYFRHVNDLGGIHGRKVKIIVEDDRYTIPMHIAAFKKLVYRDNVFMIMEVGGTGQMLALVSQFTKLKIPNFLTSTSRVFVRPTLPYHFTNGATYEDEMEIIFNWLMNILKVKDPRIALVRPDTEHGKVGSRSVKEQSEKYGLKLVGEVIVSPGALETSSEVLRLKRTKPQYVIAHLTPSICSIFLKDARKFKCNAFFIGTKYTCIESMLQLAGKAATNFHATNSFAGWDDDTPGVKALREIVFNYSPGTEGERRTRAYTQGWAECTIVNEGLKRAGKNLTREGLIKAWEGIKDLDMQGISSNVTYGPDKHQASEYCKFFKANIEKGFFVPVSDWIKAAQ
ncbi:MAG: ABC transporter substrate-binding protein [Thermodesulfobacteriota bacterium]|nr:ABC transporter substrate-binding protein [Thermodesulfobacteriota bacterium]